MSQILKNRTSLNAVLPYICFDIALILQQNRLRWYGHVLRKDDDDWVINAWSMKLRVQDQGEDQRGPGKRLFERTVRHVS